jgi:hypothetical protein
MRQFKVSKLNRSGTTGAGDAIVLNVLDDQTQPVRMFVPSELSTAFLLRVQEACLAMAVQKKERPPREVTEAISFEGIRLAIDATQRVRIHLDLQGDMSLGLSATPDDIRRLRDACDALLAQIEAGGDAAH